MIYGFILTMFGILLAIYVAKKVIHIWKIEQEIRNTLKEYSLMAQSAPKKRIYRALMLLLNSSIHRFSQSARIPAVSAGVFPSSPMCGLMKL
jgi:hypothetical protein